MPGSARSIPRKAKAAPGVLAVITGADYKAAGFGDLPVPGGLKRRGDTPGYKPRYPALVEDRVRMIGDYVAFVVAETYYQALDAAELIEIDYEPLPAIVSTGDAMKPGVPLVWDDCPNNIGFIQIEGNKEATDAAFAKAAHVVKHHFVINRVTAATMEPRGCIGLYEPIEQPLHHLHHAAAHERVSDRAVAIRSEGSRQQDSRRLRRHRRQLRHEVRRL
jgi:carbon-monoxide dehydrogenase large subunit